MTTHRRKIADPRTPQPTATPSAVQWELSDEDLRELREPAFDIGEPEYPERLLRHAEFVITICASDWYKERFPDARLNLEDALRTGQDRNPQPEPDLEAEP